MIHDGHGKVLVLMVGDLNVPPLLLNTPGRGKVLVLMVRDPNDIISPPL